MTDLNYKGIGSGIVRILAEYPEIQLENDASAKEFKVIIKRIILKLPLLGSGITLLGRGITLLDNSLNNHLKLFSTGIIFYLLPQYFLFHFLLIL